MTDRTRVNIVISGKVSGSFVNSFLKSDVFNFSFKTKGNLTKHMKSKAHFKKYSATSCTSTQNSVSSSDSEDSETESGWYFL